MTGQAGAERVGQALAQDRGSNVGVKDDNAHASPVCREAWMNEMNSSSSSSDSNRSGAGQLIDRLDRADALAAKELLRRDVLGRAPGGLVVRAAAGHDVTLLSLPVVPINVSSTGNAGHDQRAAAASPGTAHARERIALCASN
jgi:hypothetical protein